MQKNILRLNQPNLDGIGAQFHRIIAAYAIARKLKLHFQYDFLSKHDNQIFAANKVELSKWNNLLRDLIPNYSDDESLAKSVILHRNQRLIPVCAKIAKSLKNKGQNIHVIDSPHTITNKHPSFLESLDFSHALGANYLKSDSRDLLQIVLHIRRGELGLSQFKERYLPLGYYENILQNIVLILEKKGIPFEVIVPVEPGQDNILSSDDPKVIQSLLINRENPNLVQVSKHQFKLCYEVPNSHDYPHLMSAKWVESGDVWKDFLLFLNSDIFVMSKSSLSYIAAIINKKKQIIYPDFWHPKLSSWLSAKNLDSLKRSITSSLNR